MKRSTRSVPSAKRSGASAKKEVVVKISNAEKALLFYYILEKAEAPLSLASILPDDTTPAQRKTAAEQIALAVLAGWTPTQLKRALNAAMKKGWLGREKAA